MTKCILQIGVLLGLSTVVNAQNFQGQATYESKTSVDQVMSNFRGDPNRNTDPKMEARMKERMTKALEKTYVLTFDKTTSNYNEEEKLEAETAGGRGMRMGGFNSSEKLFKDVKNKIYLSEKDLMGKEFIVQDSLTNFAWQLGSETRKIGEYTAYKATVTLPAASLFGGGMLRLGGPRPGEAPKADATTKSGTASKTESAAKNKEVSKDAKEEQTSKTSFLKDTEKLKDITVTAWYTPEIPVNQGPGKYWGLPGLILEINDGMTTVVCSKIILNPTNKLSIKMPKGKTISQSEFEKIAMQKMEEMREQFSGRGGNIRFPGGGGGR